MTRESKVPPKPEARSPKAGTAVLVSHPDGRICEVPVEVLDKHVVPPERVKELSRQAGARAAAAEAHGAPAESHSIVLPATGQTVVFNFYLGPQARLAMHQEGPGAPEKPEGTEVEGYHMDIDSMGSMTMHTDWRVGPYIDKSGRPAFGPHSHDPAAGNAQ